MLPIKKGPGSADAHEMRIAVATLLSGLLALSLIVELPASAEASRPPNFIVFVVDMLRADHLGLYGYPKATSPNLDRLGAKGVVFENATSAAPWTLPSTVSLLTGLLPSEHGAGDRQVDETTRAITYPSDTAAWLPKRFAEKGYATVAFHSHPYLLRSVSSIHEGFDEYVYAPAEKGASDQFRLGTPSSSEHMYMDTLYPPVERWLAGNHDRPFFMYVHVIDVHGPYKHLRILDEDRAAVKQGLQNGTLTLPRARNQAMYQASDVQNPGKSYLYDGHLRYVDDHLGMLHRKLEKLGIAEDTYIVFTSDHGEGFGEHKDYWGHGKYVHGTQVRVPLAILSHRDVQVRPRRIKSHVNTVGLLPTLAALAKIEMKGPRAERGFACLLQASSEPETWKYPSLNSASLGSDMDAFTLDGRYKLVSDHESGIREIFDLHRDANERQPLDRNSQPPALRSKLDQLVRERARLEQSLVPAAPASRELDDDQIRALEALGYVH